MGGRVDKSINRAKEHYVFRISVKNYHHIVSLLSEHGKNPQFAQLYIYNTENEIDNTINTMRHEEVEPQIVRGISEMLDDHNFFVKSFRMERDRYLEQPESVFHLHLLTERRNNGRQYNTPTTSEVAGLIIGELTDANFQCELL